MVSLSSKLLLVLLICSFLFLAGCSTKYVCYDGTVKKNERDCPTFPVSPYSKLQIENAVDTYSSAHALVLSARHHRVNTYRVEGDWVSEVIFTNVRDSTVNYVTLKIDGLTSTIMCVEGCDYLITNKNINNLSLNNLTEDNNSGNDYPGFNVY